LDNFKYINLNVLKEYKKIYPEAILGLSDHTPGHASVLGAVTLGARVIEKHFTDNIEREGPDHKFSMNFNTWKDMVSRTRELENALGGRLKKVEDNEKETVELQRRSIRAKKNIPQGSIIHKEDIEFLRPCPKNALPPYFVDKLKGNPASRNIMAGDCFFLSDIN
jgi:N-acetylneuraminate synthase